MQISTAPRLSVVIPAYNEEMGIEAALTRVAAALEGINGVWQIIVVDDGSSDRTAALVEKLIATIPQLELVQLSRNFGHQNAITAGLAATRGEYTAIMDADLQDPPELLPRFLEEAEGGADVVYGVRKTRRASPIKKTLYWIYYRLLRAISEQPVPLDAGDFCLMSARVVEALNAMPERVRYLRGLRNWVGFRQVGVEYDRPDRHSGGTKYSYYKLFRLAGAGVLSSSRLPLKLSIYLGVGLAALGFLWALRVIYARFAYGVAPQGFSATIVAVLCLGGAQLVAIGVLGQYLSRVLDQVEGRPHYLVSRVVRAETREGE